MADKSRRTPRQARAEGTVDAILDAAFQLLEADGVEKLTTNHVAARAPPPMQVSITSNN